jgi:hypothetical protein
VPYRSHAVAAVSVTTSQSRYPSASSLEVADWTGVVVIARVTIEAATLDDLRRESSPALPLRPGLARNDCASIPTLRPLESDLLRMQRLRVRGRGEPRKELFGSGGIRLLHSSGINMIDSLWRTVLQRCGWSRSHAVRVALAAFNSGLRSSAFVLGQYALVNCGPSGSAHTTSASCACVCKLKGNKK